MLRFVDTLIRQIQFLLVTLIPELFSLLVRGTYGTLGPSCPFFLRKKNHEEQQIEIVI